MLECIVINASHHLLSFHTIRLKNEGHKQRRKATMASAEAKSHMHRCIAEYDQMVL